MVLGPPLDDATTMGPIVSAEQFDRVRGYIGLGQDEGAELLIGGRSGGELFADGSPLADGYYVEPTLLRAPHTDLRVCQEEIFGPVAAVIPFRDDDHALGARQRHPVRARRGSLDPAPRPRPPVRA